MVQIRDVVSEEIEAALAGQKPAKDALDAGVTRSNQILRQFERSVSR
jgi:sn-glycerol 3-phosphate transport system substrate-binding protein